MVLVEIYALQIDAASGSPILLLREVDDPHRVLPIMIGSTEAMAIALGIQGVVAERPLTHDLLAGLLESTGTRLDEVALTEVREGTFFAELHLTGTDGPHVVSSRPSDALALAVRVGAPVFAADQVLDEEGAILRLVDDNDDNDEEEETVAEFRNFLDAVNPEDFGN